MKNVVRLYAKTLDFSSIYRDKIRKNMKTNFDRTCRTGAKTRDGKLKQQPGDNFLQMKDNEKGHSVNADGINPGVLCKRRWWDSNPRASCPTTWFRVKLVMTTSIHLQNNSNSIITYKKKQEKGEVYNFEYALSSRGNYYIMIDTKGQRIRRHQSLGLKHKDGTMCMQWYRKG